MREVAVTNQAEPEQHRDPRRRDHRPRGERAARRVLRDPAGEFDRSKPATTRAAEGITQFTEISIRQLRRAPDPAARLVASPRPATRPPASTPARPRRSPSSTRRGRAAWRMRKTDEAGQLLAGACFALRQRGPRRLLLLRQRRQRRQPRRGVIAAGHGGARQRTSCARPNRRSATSRAADQEVTITANQRSQVTVGQRTRNRNRSAPAICASSRSIPSGRALAGSCFALIDGERPGARAALRRRRRRRQRRDPAGGVAPGSTPCARHAGPPPTIETAADVAVEIVETAPSTSRSRTGSAPGASSSARSTRTACRWPDACFDLVEDDGRRVLHRRERRARSSPISRRASTAWWRRKRPPGTWSRRPLDPVTVRPGSTATR